MNRRKNKKGFTLAELMLVVAIIIILASLAFVGVTRYLRDLRLLEMDNAAKELYFAAQNRISAALVSGDLGRLKPDDYSADVPQTVESVSSEPLHVVVFPNTNDMKNTLLDELLPFGSIDETIRANGSYIITYTFDPDSNLANIWDVWYTSKWRGVDHKFSSEELSSLYENTRGEDKKNTRKNYGSDKAVIGHYGSTGITLPRSELAVTDFQLINKEELYLTGTVQIVSGELKLEDVSVNIIVEGRESHAKKIVPLTSLTNAENATEGYDTKTGKFLFVLDDITTESKQFSRQFIRDDKNTELKFIPGEDIQVTAEVYSNAAIANIDRATAADNSLFQYVKQSADKKTAEAGIGYFRHLQNLSSAVSGVDLGINDIAHSERLGINSALQTANLVWKKVESTDPKGFVDFERPVLFGTGQPIGGSVYGSSKLTTNSFYPLDLEIVFEYDAGIYDEDENTHVKKLVGKHSISNLVVDGQINAGLFGTVEAASDVTVSDDNNTPNFLLILKNLVMDKANITGTKNAGVIVANELSAVQLDAVSINTATVRATSTSMDTCAGGAVGKAVNGLELITVSVTESSIQAQNGNAGGLVGEFSESGDTSTGVHIEIYKSSVVNKAGDKPVTGKVAGGLVGLVKAAFPKFTNSYSTAIVSGTDVAGGLVGSITNSYYDSSKKVIGYIRGCYVGGHVVNSDSQAKPVIYSPTNFNVTATANIGIAGGFIGKIEAGDGSGLEVTACYSTASTKGETAGGFVGQVTGTGVEHTSISNCYAVGLVDGIIADPKSEEPVPFGAFAGSVPNNFVLVNNRYFELINEDKPAVGSKNVIVGTAENKIYAAESSLQTYNSFFVNSPAKKMEAYNESLGNMFKVADNDIRYFLPTVKTLAEGLTFGANDPPLTLDTHVGDWQPVDTLVFNTKATTPTEP